MRCKAYSLLFCFASIIHGANYRIQNIIATNYLQRDHIRYDQFYTRQELVEQGYLPLIVPREVPLTKKNLLQSDAWIELLEDASQQEKDKVLHSLMRLLDEERDLSTLRGPIAAVLYAGARWCQHGDGRVYHDNNFSPADAKELVQDLIDNDDNNVYYDPLTEIFKLGATLEEYGYLPHTTPTEAPLKSQYLLRVDPWKTVSAQTPISCNELLECLVERYNEGWGTYKELRIPIAAALCAGARVTKQVSPSTWENIVHPLIRHEPRFKRDRALARLCFPNAFELEDQRYFPVLPADIPHAALDDLSIQQAPWSMLKDAPQTEKDAVLQKVLKRHGKWLPYEAMRRAIVTAMQAGASIHNWVREDIVGNFVLPSKESPFGFNDCNSLSIALLHKDFVFAQWLMLRGAQVRREHAEITSLLNPDEDLCNYILQKHREGCESNKDLDEMRKYLGRILKYLKTSAIVDVLLQHGASVSEDTLLIQHCQDGNHAIVKSLVAHGADPFKKYEYSRERHYTPLEAIYYGRFMPIITTSAQTKLETLRALCSGLSAQKYFELFAQRDSRGNSPFDAAEKDKEESSQYEHMCTVLRENVATVRNMRHREIHGAWRSTK